MSRFVTHSSILPWWSLVAGHHHQGLARERAAFLAATGIRSTDRELAAVGFLRALQLVTTARPSHRSAAIGLVEGRGFKVAARHEQRTPETRSFGPRLTSAGRAQRATVLKGVHQVA